MGKPCAYESLCKEYVVGGIYIRLFIANPSWTVRHPKQFATELVEQLLLLLRPQKNRALLTASEKENNEHLEQGMKALVLVAIHHPSTLDQVSS